MVTIDKHAMLAELEGHRAVLEAECPDELVGSWRNRDETMYLGDASSDVSRIKILGRLARANEVDPNNSLFFLDVARHFDDPRKAKDAQRLAQFVQIPRNPLGAAERLCRRVVHPSLNKYVKMIDTK